MSTSYGFYISKLALQGGGKPEAVVEFVQGCNIVSGASNTGKTFILQCINFVFGSGSKPKDIPEANGYKYVFLEIKTPDGKVFTLMRDLVDHAHTIKTESDLGDFWNLHKENRVEVLNSTKVGSKKTPYLSEFLLRISGFSAAEKLRTNHENKKRDISFRDIAHLTIIDEETIIKEGSPVLNSGTTVATAEVAVFRLLLSGEDSSELMEVPDATKQKAFLQAQLQLVEDMSKKAAEKITRYTREVAPEDDALFDDEISKINDQYIEIEAALNRRLEERKTLRENIDSIEARILETKELLIRFKILEAQYKSDLHRLEFLSQGEYLLSQLGAVECDCPFCGSHIKASELTEEARESISGEASKIRIHLKELILTISANEEEVVLLTDEFAEIESKYKACEKEIAQNLEPFKVSIQDALHDLALKQKNSANLNSVRGELSTLSEKRNELDADIKGLRKIKGSSGFLPPKDIDDFVQSVKTLLVQWKFISANAFLDFDSEREVDIKIDGVSRRANGKGVRALLYSAFILGLMMHCFKKKLHHPLVVVLDTPLHAFKDKDPDLKDRPEVREAFFEYLVNWPEEMQLIILENQEPSQSIKSKLHYIHFSGRSDRGRAAFIPVETPSLEKEVGLTN